MELIPAPPVPIPRLSCEISCSVNSGGGFPGCKFLSLIPAPTTSSTVGSCSVPAALQRCQNTKNTTGNEGEDGLPGQMPQGNPGGAQKTQRQLILLAQAPAPWGLSVWQGLSVSPAGCFSERPPLQPQGFGVPPPLPLHIDSARAETPQAGPQTSGR